MDDEGGSDFLETQPALTRRAGNEFRPRRHEVEGGGIRGG